MDQEEFNLWKWVFGAAATILTGIFTGTWAVAAKTKDIEAQLDQAKKDSVHNADRIKMLEDAQVSQQAFCEKQQDQLTKAITASICASVKEMLSTDVLRQTKEIAEINKNIALIAQSQEMTKDDITEIFARLNNWKRTGSTSNDTGLRRRYIDFVEHEEQ